MYIVGLASLLVPYKHIESNYTSGGTQIVVDFYSANHHHTENLLSVAF